MSIVVNAYRKQVNNQINNLADFQDTLYSICCQNSQNGLVQNQRLAALAMVRQLKLDWGSICKKSNLPSFKPHREQEIQEEGKASCSLEIDVPSSLQPETQDFQIQQQPDRVSIGLGSQVLELSERQSNSPQLGRNKENNPPSKTIRFGALEWITQEGIESKTKPNFQIQGSKSILKNNEDSKQSRKRTYSEFFRSYLQPTPEDGRDASEIHNPSKAKDSLMIAQNKNKRHRLTDNAFNSQEDDKFHTGRQSPFQQESLNDTFGQENEEPPQAFSFKHPTDNNSILAQRSSSIGEESGRIVISMADRIKPPFPVHQRSLYVNPLSNLNQFLSKSKNYQQQRQPLAEITHNCLKSKMEKLSLEIEEYKQRLPHPQREEAIGQQDPEQVSLHQEFVNCQSEYAISEKEFSEDISSDGEFVEAGQIFQVYEDDSFIDKISQWGQQEQANSNQSSSRTRAPVPRTYVQGKITFKEDQKYPLSSNTHTKRYQGLKYFNTVGYTKNKHKAIPRWCTNMELLDKVIQYQKNVMSSDDIFGKLDPRQLKLSHALMFAGMKSSLRKEQKFNRRGSSVMWNDDLEFATPYKQSYTQKENLPEVSKFSPFQTSKTDRIAAIRQRTPLNRSVVEVSNGSTFLRDQLYQGRVTPVGNMTTVYQGTITEESYSPDNMN